MFMRAHPNHLIPCPSESRSMQCARYFPGIDFALMHDWWLYVDEGGSIAAEDVAYAIQYAVIYQFLKYVDHLQTRDAAKEYIVYGVTAEAEWINAHKGTYPETEKEVRVIAVNFPEDNQLINEFSILPSNVTSYISYVSYDLALSALLAAFDQNKAYSSYAYDSMSSSFSSGYSGF